MPDLVNRGKAPLIIRPPSYAPATLKKKIVRSGKSVNCRTIFVINHSLFCNFATETFGASSPVRPPPPHRSWVCFVVYNRVPIVVERIAVRTREPNARVDKRASTWPPKTGDILPDGGGGARIISSYFKGMHNTYRRHARGDRTIIIITTNRRRSPIGIRRWHIRRSATSSERSLKPFRARWNTRHVYTLPYSKNLNSAATLSRLPYALVAWPPAV